MALLGTLQVRMGLDTASFGQKFNNFTKDLQKRAGNLGKGLSGLTNIGSLVGGAGIGAALTQGIQIAGQFESTINQVAAAADLGADSIAGLSKIALDLSKGTVFSANQAAEAMLALAKAGITPAEQAAGGLAATMQLAATEGMELSFAAEVVANTMGAFGLAAKDSASIADALAGASIASTASVQGLALSLSQVSAVAKLNGSNLNDTAGALALFAQRGIQGSDAGTSLKTMFLRLIPSTKAARNTMEAYGIEFVNANGSMKSLTEIAGILKNQLGGLSEAQRTSALQAMFGTDAYRAAAILTESGAEGLQKYIDATHDKNAAEKLSEARTQGFAGAMLKLKNSFTSLAIELGKGGFLDALTKLATKGAELVSRLSTLPQWAKNTAVGFAIAAAALPPVALAIASIAAAVPAVLTVGGALVGFFTGPWGIALVAAVGLAVAFKDNLIAAWEELKAWFAGWVQSNQPLLQQLKTAWDGFLASFGPLFAAAKVAIGNFAAEVAKAFGTNTTGLFESFKSAAGTALQWIVQGATFAIQGLTAFVGWITANLPAAGTAVGSTVASIIRFFQSMGEKIAGVWQWVKDAFASASAALSTGFNWLMGALAPVGAAFTTWGQVAIEAFGVVKSAGTLVWDAMKLGFSALVEALTPFWEKLKEFGSWIATTFGPPLMAVFNQVKEVGMALWNGLKTSLQEFWEFCKTAVAGIVASFQELGNKALAPLRKLREGIDSAREALNVFGDAGEHETDRAVGNSWLTDLCEKGISWFNALVTDGVAPAGAALTEFGKKGIEAQGMMKGLTSGSLSLANGSLTAGDLSKISQQQFAGIAKTSKEAAIQVQSVWTSAMNHVGSAIDEFVKTGKLNFSELVRSIIADIASAALKNAFNGLLQGIMGITTGGSAGGSGGGLLSGIGSIFGGIFGGLATFEGGGYTGNGARAGGLDGRGGRLAMIHPQETVVDHTRVKKAADRNRRGDIHVSTPITLMPGVSKEELATILPMLKRDIIDTIPRLIQLGGSYAGAYGQ